MAFLGLKIWPKFETSNISRDHSLNTKCQKYSPGRHDRSRLPCSIPIAIAASHWSTGDYSFDLSSILYNTKDNLRKNDEISVFRSRMKLRSWEGIPPTRHSMTSSPLVHVLQSTHFLFDNLKFEVLKKLRKDPILVLFHLIMVIFMSECERWTRTRR